MKSSFNRALLAAVASMALFAGASAASAATVSVYELIYSNFGSAPFGTVTVTDFGDGKAHVVEDVSPNWILNTGNDGNHLPLAFTLAGSGYIDKTSLGSLFSVANGSSLSQPPFGSFKDGIDGACGNGASGGGCGSTLIFDILSFSGFESINWDSGSSIIPIFFASDLADRTGCTGNCAGSVGASTPMQTPLPAAAPLFAAGLGLMAWLGATRRRKKSNILSTDGLPRI